MIKYLWPDAPLDEYGSIRDHKELPDKIIPARGDALFPDDVWALEIKSHAWPKGSKALRSFLKQTLGQANVNALRYVEHVKLADDIYHPPEPLVAYLPKGQHPRDAIMAWVTSDDGELIIMFAEEFRNIYLSHLQPEE